MYEAVDIPTDADWNLDNLVKAVKLLTNIVEKTPWTFTPSLGETNDMVNLRNLLSEYIEHSKGN